MNKDYLLFDLDGTLTDSGPGITRSARYALNAFGIVVDDPNELLMFVGPPLRESFQKFYSFSPAQAEQAVAKFREYYTERGLYENTLYPGVGEALQTLSDSGKQLILATSKAAVYAEKILKHFDLYPYFSFVAGDELDGSRSQKADLIRYALQHENITALDKAVMIGDREHDILGAKQVGMDSVGVLYGYGSREELEAAGATWIVGNVEELLKYFCLVYKA